MRALYIGNITSITGKNQYFINNKVLQAVHSHNVSVSLSIIYKLFTGEYLQRKYTKMFVKYVCYKNHFISLTTI